VEKKRGFTIIELTVVILIIALLIALIFPRLFDTLEDAKTNAELTELRMIRTAIQCIADDNYANHTGNVGVSYGDENLIYFKAHKDGTLALTDNGLTAIKELIDASIGTVESFRIGTNGALDELTYTTLKGSEVRWINGKAEMLKLY
jgi:prepilin-type N-terminal cleavage/methylation domain-containing protein